MTQTTKGWLEGLAASAITSFSTAAIAALALPTVFNGSKDGIWNIAKITITPALISIFTYLKKSPLPSDVETVTVTATKETSK